MSLRRARAGRVRLAAGVLVAALALGGPVASFAQIPGLLPSTSKDAKDAPKPAPEAETPAQGLARAKRQIEETRVAIARREAAPAGVAEAEASELAEVLQETLSAYQAQVRAYDGLAKAGASRREAEARGTGASTLATPPPYSILLVDELRGNLARKRARIDTLLANEGQLKREAERYFVQSQRAGEALRRAREALDVASGDARPAAAWRLKVAEARERLDAARTTLATLAARTVEDEIAAARIDVAVIEADLERTRGATRFTREDLDRAIASLRETSARYRREQERLGVLAADFQKQRDAASRELDRVRGVADVPAEEKALPEARLAHAEARLRANEQEIDAARGLARLNDAMIQAWNDRFTASDPSELLRRAEAVERLRRLAATLASWAGYAGNLVAEARAQVQAADAGQVGTVATPAVSQLRQDAVDAARRGVAAYDTVKEELERAIGQVDLWIADVDKAEVERPLGQRIAEGWATLKSAARAVWNFELFSVEDSVVVDGQHVSVARGVTVGKSLGALLIFLGGLWAVGRMLGVIERRMVGRGFNAPRVRTFKRWGMLLASLVLLLLTLNAARIPFTVFAFLGGALAIGVGFGTQTIIRNFISGMIVLAERRVRIGDTIEVDGVTGTVTSVDVRSTTVRGFEGVETIVPNSALLENKVTNWTFTDQKVRRSVRIGVAYGSNLRDVAEMLEETVKRHGNVLADPPPQVYLEDFGDSAVVFLMHFWVDLSQVPNSMRVMSDLRFMVGKRLDEAGIVIAYPQRDVHLDAPRPIRVEVVRGATGAGDGSEAKG